MIKPEQQLGALIMLGFGVPGPCPVHFSVFSLLTHLIQLINQFAALPEFIKPTTMIWKPVVYHYSVK